MEIIEKDILQNVIRKRQANTHKGDYGRVLVIGGNLNFGGAAIMAAEGALNTGIGLLTVASHPMNLNALHARIPEAMFVDWRDHKTLQQLIPQMDVIIIGPGMGTDDFAIDLLQHFGTQVTKRQTVILDASALDLIGQDHTLLPIHANHLILTPHQMEWQRLTNLYIPYQSDSANKTALSSMGRNVTLVLKSDHTKIYDQSKTIWQNPTGNPGMATGGMGDTLSGIIGGFVAQFGPTTETIKAAVYLHSYIADQLAQKNYFVRPTTISAKIPQVMRQFTQS